MDRAADESRAAGRTGEDPRLAARDAENASRQRDVERNREALEEQSRRVEATAPEEVKDHTVGEIVEEAERESGVNLRS